MLKMCVVCNEEKEADKFLRNNDGSFRNHYCYSCRGKRERAQLKLDFLIAFNFKCSCCEESDPRFLTLDHVNNDGNLHREKLKTHQIMSEARREGWPKDKYTCLCFNCNSGRSVNGGICPHKCISKEEHIEQLTSKCFKLGRQHVNHNTSNLPEARKQLKKNREIAKALSGFTQDQIDALVASLTK